MHRHPAVAAEGAGGCLFVTLWNSGEWALCHVSSRVSRLSRAPPTANHCSESATVAAAHPGRPLPPQSCSTGHVPPMPPAMLHQCVCSRVYAAHQGRVPSHAGGNRYARAWPGERRVSTYPSQIRCLEAPLWLSVYRRPNMPRRQLPDSNMVSPKPRQCTCPNCVDDRQACSGGGVAGWELSPALAMAVCSSSRQIRRRTRHQAAHSDAQRIKVTMLAASLRKTCLITTSIRHPSQDPSSPFSRISCHCHPPCAFLALDPKRR
jgi:hypothetical protein